MLVASENGTNKLLIEVKRLEDNEVLAANAFHRRATALMPGSFLLFVSTRQFWLWAPAATAPTHQGDTAALLRRYLDLDRVPLASLTEWELNLVVYSWVSSVMFKPAATLLELPEQEWLVRTGLHPVIHRGYIQREGLAGE